jgi:hypothetical protein
MTTADWDTCAVNRLILHVHLSDTVGAGPAEQGVPFDEGERVSDRGRVALSICAATAGLASAHSVDTLFTGETSGHTGDRGCLRA